MITSGKHTHASQTLFFDSTLHSHELILPGATGGQESELCHTLLHDITYLSVWERIYMDMFDSRCIPYIISLTIQVHIELKIYSRIQMKIIFQPGMPDEALSHSVALV